MPPSLPSPFPLPCQIYSSPPSVVLHRLYNMLLRDELNEFAYEAAMAGLSYSVTTRTTGLSVKVLPSSPSLCLPRPCSHLTMARRISL